MSDLLQVTAKVKRWSQELFPYIKEVAQSNEENPYATKEIEGEENILRTQVVKEKLAEKGIPNEEIEAILEKVLFLPAQYGHEPHGTPY